MTAIWTGDVSLQAALASGALEAHGPADLRRRLSRLARSQRVRPDQGHAAGAVSRLSERHTLPGGSAERRWPDQVRRALAERGPVRSSRGNLAGAELEDGSLTASRDAKRGLEQPHRIFEQALERVVVVGRVVMEQNHLLRADPRRELERVAVRAVPPADAAGILLIGELGVVDQQIGARRKLVARGPFGIEPSAVLEASAGSWSGR